MGQNGSGFQHSGSSGMLGHLVSLNGQKWFSERCVAGVGCRGVWEEKGGEGI